MKLFPEGDLPRAVRMEIFSVGILFLLALISVPLIRWMAAWNAAEEKQQRIATWHKMKDKIKEFYEEEHREEQELADVCRQIALERIWHKSGGEDPFDFYVWRNSIHLQHDGFSDFVENFNRGTTPILDPSERVKETESMRKALYGKYHQAKRALAAAEEQSTTKDEFETEAEHKSRIRNKNRVIGELAKKRDKLLDDIVALEKTCNAEVLYASVNGFYALDEVLIFVPMTDWNYDAEQGVFNVRCREITPPRREWGMGPFGVRAPATIQAFNFSLRECRVSQFVESGMIKCQYRLEDDGWRNPRRFKEYKQQHPFLLMRLGPCDLKVQGTTDRIKTMPFSRIKLHRNNSCQRPSVSEKTKAVCIEKEREAQKIPTLIFNVDTGDGFGGILPVVEVFADYETEEGRAEIENVLQHFEDRGGLYYKAFCKAVRSELAR